MQLTLRKKVFLSLVALILILGMSTVLITRAILLRVLKAEFRHKGLNSARSLAANSVADVLTQNNFRLKRLVENEKNLDKDIAYAFIMDSGKHVFAHTFEKGFPVDLLEANNSISNSPFNARLLDTQMGFIYDIAVPVFSGKSLLAYVRLGLVQNSIQKTINTINLIFLGITAAIIFIAVFLAQRLSGLATLDERNRIALDLHDCCAQDLASIIKRLELAEKLFKIEPARAIEELSNLREVTRELLIRTRQVIFELKSDDDNGFNFYDKLTAYLEDYKRTTDIIVKSDMADNINIPRHKARTIFYIITEALSNVRKHSGAKNVDLSLKFNGSHKLMIDIRDNGRGFDINNTKIFKSGSGKWGLMSMRQRVDSLEGTLAIDSSPQKGTKISINVSLT